ncbi:hypothetical protein D3C80_1292860 [compost metagenome]
MVLGQYQDVIIRRYVEQADPQQRTLLQVETVVGFFFKERLDPGFTLASIEIGGQGVSADGHRGRRMNHLLHTLGVFTEGGAQCLMPFKQGIEAGLQGRHVQLAVQAQGGRQVVVGAVRRQLPEEPLALLGIGQRQRRHFALHCRDRQVGRRDALFEHLLQVQATLVQRQGDEALGDAQGDSLVHHSSSISSNSASSLLSLALLSCSPDCSSCSTNAPRVGYWKSICGVNFIPSSS